MPADDLQAGVFLEGPGQDQAQDLEAGFVVPSGQRELRGDLGGEAAVVGLLNVQQRDARVGVERHVQVVQFFQHGRILRIVQKRRPRAAEEQHAFEPELGDGPVEFSGGGLRVCQGRAANPLSRAGWAPIASASRLLAAWVRATAWPAGTSRASEP